MRVEYINPFVDAVNKLFKSMFEAKVEAGRISLSETGGGPYDVTAVIGLSGWARGSVTISFPEATALAMVGKLLDAEVDKVDKTVTDGLAEFVNIIAGSAKTSFSRGGPPIELSLPNCVRGENFQIIFPSKAVWVEVPFESEFGPFSLRVIFEMPNNKGGSK